MKIKAQTDTPPSRVFESSPPMAGRPSMEQVLQLWRNGRFLNTGLGTFTSLPIQRLRLKNEPPKGFRLAKESETDDVIDTEQLEEGQRQRLYSILMAEGNFELASRIKAEWMAQPDTLSDRPDISELLHQSKVLEDMEKKGGKLDATDQQNLLLLETLLDKAQRFVNTHIKDPDAVFIRDILVPLRRRSLTLNPPSESSGAASSGQDQPHFDLSVGEAEITAYRAGVKMMGSYGSMGEGECIAKCFKMQVPVFEVVDEYYVLIDTWGASGGFSAAGAWGVVHLGNHYVAVQGAVRGEAVDRSRWVYTALSGDCLFEAMLVIAKALGKVKPAEMNLLIKKLRIVVARNMPPEAIRENIIEMILFGNTGQADPVTAGFVRMRRNLAFSAYRIRQMTKERLDILLESRGNPEYLVTKATEFLQAKAGNQPLDRLLPLYKGLEKYMQAYPVRNLGYNEKEVSLFLVKAGSLAKDQVIPRKDPLREDIMLYHVTSFRNLLLIQQNGLDPAFGAGAGGSCAIGGNEKLQKSSKENTKGKIAAGTSNSVVAAYIHQRIAWAELVKELPVANFEIQLRFSSKVAKDWAIDPDNPNGAWHTKTIISPDNIEALLFDGWHPIVELDIQELVGKSAVPDFDSGKIYMAFTLEELVKKVKEASPLQGMVERSSSAADILEALERIKTNLAMQEGNIQIVGASAHPIREPHEWLFVVYTTDPDSVDRNAKARYEEKIGRPGWV